MSNSRTTIYGTIFLVFQAIAIQPQLVDFLPATWAGYIKGVALLISSVAGLMGFKNTADSASVQKTTDILEEKIDSVMPENKKSTLKVYE